MASSSFAVSRLLLVAALVGACSSDPATPDGSGPAGKGGAGGTPSAGGGGSGGVAAGGAGGADAASAEIATGTGGSSVSPPASDAGTSDGGAEAGASDAAAGEAAAPTGVLKIMVLGSSNELGTCWRAYLWQKLRAEGITNFDFVGAQNSGPDCGVAGYDKHTESRNGNLITRNTAAQWTAMFSGSKPDIIISHVGGADLLQGVANDRIVQAFDLAVNSARMVNPRINFMVGEHTPMEPGSCANCKAKVMDLNAKIAAWAPTKTTAEAPVSAVDLFTGLDVATDTSDRVHLTNSGSQKVADKWLAVLLPVFKP